MPSRAKSRELMVNEPRFHCKFTASPVKAQTTFKDCRCRHLMHSFVTIDQVSKQNGLSPDRSYFSKTPIPATCLSSWSSGNRLAGKPCRPQLSCRHRAAPPTVKVSATLSSSSLCSTSCSSGCARRPDGALPFRPSDRRDVKGLEEVKFRIRVPRSFYGAATSRREPFA